MIRIELLGGLRITLDGAPLDSLLHQRLRSAIIAYTAVERDVSREALLRLFWPDRDSEKARHALSQNLYELRRAMGTDWLQVNGERLTLSDDVVVDVRELEAALTSNQPAHGWQLYSGSFLANVAIAENPEFEHWVDSKRAHYARQFRKLVRQAVNDQTAAGALDQAIAVALHATHAEPLEDEFHHMVIELLARAGRRADALRHFELYERLLRENGLAALDETVFLVGKLRNGEELPPIETLPASPAASLSLHAAPTPRQPAISHRKTAAFIIGGAVIVAAALPLFWSSKRKDTPSYLFDANLIPDRVAVLPFDASPEAARLEDPQNLRNGLADALARSPQIDIAPRNVVDDALRTKRNPAEIATAAQSLLLVAGSLTVDSTALVLTLRILDGATGQRLTTRTFSATRGAGALRMQATDYLSDELVRTLNVLSYRREAKQESAWHLFNRALENFRSAGELATAAHPDAALRALSSADSLLAVAEKIDRNWLAPTLMRVQVAARTAYVCSNPNSGRTPAEAQQWYVAAIAQGDRALERRPGNPDALEMRGLARYELWRWRAGMQSVNDVGLRRSAQQDLEDAITADYRRSRSWLALAGIADGLADAAQEKRLALKAYEVDPTSARDRMLFFWLGSASLELAQDSEALHWCGMGLQRFPAFLPLLYCEAATRAFGNRAPADVMRMWQIVDAVRSPDQPPQMAAQVAMFEMLAASVIARAGLPDSARAVAARASAAAPGDISLMAPEALLRTRVGDYERAIDLLEKDAAQDPVWTLRVIKRAAFAPLRNRPRFQQLVARLQKS